jgi:hypothetical protein
MEDKYCPTLEENGHQPNIYEGTLDFMKLFSSELLTKV